MTEFSTERLSLGRPESCLHHKDRRRWDAGDAQTLGEKAAKSGLTCQERILTGSPRVVMRLGASVCGTFNTLKDRSHSSAMAAR